LICIPGSQASDQRIFAVFVTRIREPKALPDIPKNTIGVAVDYFTARHKLFAKRLRFLNELAPDGRDSGSQRQTRLLAMM
jgi:hypothetical protein